VRNDSYTTFVKSFPGNEAATGVAEREQDEKKEEEPMLVGKSLGEIWDTILSKFLEKRILSEIEIKKLHGYVKENEIHKLGTNLRNMLEDYDDKTAYDPKVNGIVKTTLHHLGGGLKC